MSLYDPDPGAVLDQPWDTAFVAQRDVALFVPINHHTGPMASIRAACFAHNRYEDTAFTKCFSNLIAAGFKRFLVDVYWDPGRAVWSLCPVEVPLAQAQLESRDRFYTDAASSDSKEAPDRMISRDLPRFSGEDIPRSLATGIGLLARQDGTESVAASTLSVTTSIQVSATASDIASNSDSSTSAVATPSIISYPQQNTAEPLLQIGQYNCTSTITLNLLTGLLQDYIVPSDFTTVATVLRLVLNIHAAASLLEPDSPAQQPSADHMPTSGSLISDIMRGNLSNKLYTPQKLQEDRNHVFNSWFNVAWENLPAPNYYHTTKGADGVASTQDGWPTEAFIEFKELHRLITGFGTIDPQMADYNTEADRGTIFSEHEIISIHDSSLDTAGSVTRGCLFSPSDTTITTSTNNSWAVALAPPLNLGLDPNTTIPIPALTKLTSCGLSSLLNATLSNVTADQNPTPYVAFSHSTLWTWAPGQPTNSSAQLDNDYRNRCAAISSSPPYPGRWHAVGCREKHRLACYNPDAQYNWTVSQESVDYFSGDNNICPQGTRFSVPHSSLENAHLLAAMQNSPPPPHPPSSPSPTSDDNDMVFLNFNAIDVQNCWTVNINGTCPYQARQDMNMTRVVVVPTVAAVIIFVLAALTFFVKCAANRRANKRGRRRRNVGGWEYEGVPS